MTHHTPGPWLTEREQGGGWAVWTRQPHTGTLATIHEEDINGCFPADANARIIAAAPDMLAALVAAERFMGGFEGDEMQEGIDDRLALVRAAISLAKGC